MAWQRSSYLTFWDLSAKVHGLLSNTVKYLVNYRRARTARRTVKIISTAVSQALWPHIARFSLDQSFILQGSRRSSWIACAEHCFFASSRRGHTTLCMRFLCSANTFSSLCHNLGCQMHWRIQGGIMRGKCSRSDQNSGKFDVLPA